MEKAPKKSKVYALYFTYMNKVDTIWSMFIRFFKSGVVKKTHIYIYIL